MDFGLRMKNQCLEAEIAKLRFENIKLKTAAERADRNLQAENTSLRTESKELRIDHAPIRNVPGPRMRARRQRT